MSVGSDRTVVPPSPLQEIIRLYRRHAEVMHFGLDFRLFTTDIIGLAARAYGETGEGDSDLASAVMENSEGIKRLSKPVASVVVDSIRSQSNPFGDRERALVDLLSYQHHFENWLSQFQRDMNSLFSTADGAVIREKITRCFCVDIDPDDDL